MSRVSIGTILILSELSSSYEKCSQRVLWIIQRNEAIVAETTHCCGFKKRIQMFLIL